MDFIAGDDGLPANDVGVWTTEKHNFLRLYIGISRAARRKYIGPKNAGATYIDLFCATGRARVRETGEWIDGSAVAAWKASVEGGVPFSKILISDADDEARSVCANRLKKLGAPVVEIPGDALKAAELVPQRINPHGLHFAFVDPYNLGALSFQIFSFLSSLKRIDMMVHVSAMDLQRNLEANPKIVEEFAPGWREHIDLSASQPTLRANVISYWRDKVSALGTIPSAEMKLITGSKSQRLYWLLLVSKHELARRFWSKAIDADVQGRLL